MNQRLTMISSNFSSYGLLSKPSGLSHLLLMKIPLELLTSVMYI
jgi:hypothetical protein